MITVKEPVYTKNGAYKEVRKYNYKGRTNTWLTFKIICTFRRKDLKII